MKMLLLEWGRSCLLILAATTLACDDAYNITGISDSVFEASVSPREAVLRECKDVVFKGRLNTVFSNMNAAMSWIRLEVGLGRGTR